MSVFANATYRLDDGREFTISTRLLPEGAFTKQTDKDLYDSGIYAGIGFERERIEQWLDSEQFIKTVFAWFNEVAKADIAHEDAIYEDTAEELGERLKALINGEQK